LLSPAFGLSNSFMFNWSWHPLIPSQKRRTHSFYLLNANAPNFVILSDFSCFLTHFKKKKKEDASRRHNIIGCPEVGHPLSFWRVNLWCFGPVETRPPSSWTSSRCSPLPSLALIGRFWRRRLCSAALNHQQCRNLSGDSRADGSLFKNVFQETVYCPRFVGGPLASVIGRRVWLEKSHKNNDAMAQRLN